ncbi:MAG: DUF6273 domain-containing protein [Lachnospiraceae bacterium]|nr:DUF6273 domain-containing protein [Lachnospiraceae bacterium]
MKLLKKSLALLLAMVLMMGAFSSLKAEAKEITLKTPKIKSVKLSKDGTSISITINKTNKDVEGYQVYISGEGVYDNSLYQSEKQVFRNETKFSFQDELVTTTVQPGTKKQTVKINVEDLVKIYGIRKYKTVPSGKYTFKVRGYNKKKYGTTVWSEFSKEKSLNVSITETTGEGYKTEYDFSKVSKGDIITFGAYEQDANIKNGQEPIEWVVLSKTQSQLFVVSKYVLDSLPYNYEYKGVKWETCTLRKWLNDNFYNAAFNKEEKALIKTTTGEDFDNPGEKTPGGNDTKDKIFLLSKLDMINSDYGFSEAYETEDVNRRCAPTAYAIARGVWDSGYKTKEGEAACFQWWVRSFDEYFSCFEEFVYGSGLVDTPGDHVYFDYMGGGGDKVNETVNGVRPALVINLNP